MELFKMEIACLAVVMFIGIIYSSARRKKTFAHKLFVTMLILSALVLIFEMITLYMVNHMETIDIHLNNIVHKIFIFLLVTFFYCVWGYVVNMNTGSENSRMYKVNKKLKGFWVLPIVYTAFMVFGHPIEYITDGHVNRAAGASSNVGYFFSAAYLMVTVLYFIRSRKEMNSKKRSMLIMCFVCIGVLSVIQVIWKDMLLFGAIVVLCDLTFYLTVENPDVLLIEKLQEEKERADEANNAKSAFLANMSHEIRTPMNAIVGMTEILMRTDMEPQQKGYLENIRTSGKSLLLIINDILDFSKIEAGKMELIDDEYDAVSLVNDVSMIILNRIGDKPVELIFEVDPDIPKQMYGDMGRIKQIIINLMNNAVKFTEAGYVKLKVRAEKSPLHTECKVFFDVEDTGQGIKEEDLSKLFESFQQVDSKRNRSKEGTGLGLAISKQLTEAMGGELTVKSVYGEGSTFSFYIKQRIVDSSPIAVIKPEVHELKPVVGGCFVNEIVAIATENLAKQFGFEYKSIKLENLQDAEVNHLLVDGEIVEKQRDILRDLAYKSIEIAVLQNPMKQMIGSDLATVVNKPFFSYNFAKFMNHESQSAMTEISTGRVTFTAEKAQILIVDDNEINLKVAMGLLAPLKMQIDTATSGKSAINKAKSKKYHIIFMDHMMPVMDGVEASLEIRKLEEFNNYYKDASIVALTANVSGEAKDHFAEANVLDFLPKPIDMNPTLATIKRLLPDDILDKNVAQFQVEEEEITSINIPKITGLDVIEGIKNSGSENLFKDLLSDFYNIIDMKTKKIEQCLNDNMLHDFTVEVHGLKNTARMIGAMELSSKFKELEDLGNAENTDEINLKIPKALKLFKEYKEILKPYARAASEEKEEVSNEVLIQILDEINTGIESFDLDVVDEKMATLEKYRIPEECIPFMENLRAFVSDVAMEDIIETTNNMKKLLEE